MTRTSSRGLLPAALVAVSTLVPACAPEDAAPTARGAVLVVIDTLRADHVGVYGAPADLTPHIDGFAQDAVVYADALAASSWTRPAVASLFTGRYPAAVDMLTKQDALSDEIETLAEQLSGAGISCQAVSTNGNAGRSFGFAQGFEDFHDALPRIGYPDDVQVTPAEEVTTKALDVLDGLPAEAPFFLFLHYVDPHAPYLPHPEQRASEAPPGRFDGSRARLNALDNLSDADRTSEDEARIRHLYAGEVRYCDAWIGTLLDELSQRYDLDELLVVITSDHGEGLWDHGLRGHGQDLYEEMIRVPLVVRFPSGRGPGHGRVDGFVNHVDVAPTVLAAFGLEAPAIMQGRDLAVSRGNAFGYSEMDQLGIDLESVSDGRSKLIRDRGFDGRKGAPFRYTLQERDTLRSLDRRFYGRVSHREEILALNPDLAAGTTPEGVSAVGLSVRMPARKRPAGDDLLEWYDLRTDAGESDDRSAETPDALATLRERMAAFERDNRQRRVEGRQIEERDLDRETLEDLKALGYLGDG